MIRTTDYEKLTDIIVQCISEYGVDSIDRCLCSNLKPVSPKLQSYIRHCDTYSNQEGTDDDV